MKKKIVCILLCLTLMAGLLIGCGGGSGDSPPAGSNAGTTDAQTPDNQDPGNTQATSSDDPVEIYIFISQPEYADAINELIEEYKKVKPNVTINYETTQSDYPTLLKAKLNSGSIPDIFSSTSGKEIDLYMEYSYDLTGQPLLDTMLPAVEDTMRPMGGGGPHGFAIKGNYFGILYNKDILEQAGVTAYPLTLDELEEACEKIAAAGFTPFTTGFAEWWVFKHCAMPFFSASDPNAKDLIAKFERGETKMSDHPILYENFFRYIDLIIKYGDDKPLESDISTEIAALASGQVAFVNGQGAWIEADVLRINPDIKIGFNGYPVSGNQAQCQVITGADQALRISNSSPHLQEVLDFVNWWYTSDYGISWFTDVAGVVPPVRTTSESDYEVIKQGSALADERGSGQLTVIYSTDSFHMAFGEAMQAYVAGNASRDETAEIIERKWQELEGE